MCQQRTSYVKYCTEECFSKITLNTTLNKRKDTSHGLLQFERATCLTCFLFPDLSLQVLGVDVDEVVLFAGFTLPTAETAAAETAAAGEHSAADHQRLNPTQIIYSDKTVNLILSTKSPVA